MKLSKYIEGLQEILESRGDLDCYYAIDDEGNGYQKVVYSGTIFYIHECDRGDYRLDSLYSTDDISDYPDDKFSPICVVN